MKHIVVCLLVPFLFSGCATINSSNPTEKRAAILKMKNEVLQKLYTSKPSAKAMVATAPGFAVFDNGNVNLLFVSVGGGYGVVQNNISGQRIFMKMAEGGIGLGVGVKNFQAVMVFHTKDVMRRFIEDGWQLGGHADAAAKAGNKGAAVAGEAVIDNITVFQFTENGLALQAQIKGVKFWKDEELN